MLHPKTSVKWPVPLQRSQYMNTHDTKCIILGASLETNNMGVSALVSGAITSLRKCYPNAKVSLLDYGLKPCTYTVLTEEGPATVNLLNIRFSKRFYLRNNIAWLLLHAFLLKLLPQRLSARLLSRNALLQEICDTDIVASIAGGDSFSDIYGLRRLLYVALPQILTLVLNKRLILLPQTLGPFHGFLAKRIAGYIHRMAKMVYSRDRQSIEEIGPLAGKDPSRLRFSYDMAFVLRPSANGVEEPYWLRNKGSGRLIGFNISGLLFMGGYTRNNMFRLKSDYQELVYALIQHLIEKHRAEIVLVPHVYGSGKNSESDSYACGIVYDHFRSHFSGNIHFIKNQYDQHQIKFLIGQLDFFLGSRMHACIAALSQCVPAIGLAYSRKFHGVFESIGMGELVANLREHDKDTVIALVDRVYQRRINLKARLEAEMPAVRESVLALVKHTEII